MSTYINWTTRKNGQIITARIPVFHSAPLDHMEIIRAKGTFHTHDPRKAVREDIQENKETFKSALGDRVNTIFQEMRRKT